MSFIPLFLYGTLAGILITWIFELVIKSNKKLHDRYYRQHEVVLGHHVHHSTYGLVFILAGVVFVFNLQLESALFAFGAGFGIILQHTVSERRFVFVNKWKKR
ncbi:MAG: hypothetical protein Q8Q48_02300 [Candidatus Staskawiczbacteria bacterium]|nr:hypothetical protein [Candidatus Staskawiczbacteria bacterium]